MAVARARSQAVAHGPVTGTAALLRGPDVGWPELVSCVRETGMLIRQTERYAGAAGEPTS
jgi:hypothetical protein